MGRLSLSCLIMKSVIVAILVSLLNCMCVISHWIYNSPYYFDGVLNIITVIFIAAAMKSHSFKLYVICNITFIVSLIVIEIILAEKNIFQMLFSRIFGYESKMGAGDGFLILSNYVSLFGSVILGEIIAFVMTKKNITNPKRQEIQVDDLLCE